jgi:hypothetical protein
MIHNTQYNQVGDVITHPKLGKGEYVVSSTVMTGGGTGHGQFDVYPDGHQVTLHPIGEDNIVNMQNKPKQFYQSGCFIDEVMLPYCKPIRNVKPVSTIYRS